MNRAESGNPAPGGYSHQGIAKGAMDTAEKSHTRVRQKHSRRLKRSSEKALTKLKTEVDRLLRTRTCRPDRPNCIRPEALIGVFVNYARDIFEEEKSLLYARYSEELSRFISGDPHEIWKLPSKATVVEYVYETLAPHVTNSICEPDGLWQQVVDYMFSQEGMPNSILKPALSNFLDFDCRHVLSESIENRYEYLLDLKAAAEVDRSEMIRAAGRACPQECSNSEAREGLHRPKRLQLGTVESGTAVRKLEEFLRSRHVTLTTFATQAQTTDRTLRKFLRTGRLRRSILDGIAAAMGSTTEDLLNEEQVLS